MAFLVGQPARSDRFSHWTPLSIADLMPRPRVRSTAVYTGDVNGVSPTGERSWPTPRQLVAARLLLVSDGGRELPRRRSYPVSAGAGRCRLSSTVRAARACSWCPVPARAHPFVSERLARSHSEVAYDWFRVCRPHRGGSSPCSVPLLPPDPARSGYRAAGCGEDRCGQLVARHPLPIVSGRRRVGA